jgi:hypothetical protein
MHVVLRQQFPVTIRLNQKTCGLVATRMSDRWCEIAADAHFCQPIHLTVRILRTDGAIGKTERIEKRGIAAALPPH